MEILRKRIVAGILFIALALVSGAQGLRAASSAPSVVQCNSIYVTGASTATITLPNALNVTAGEILVSFVNIHNSAGQAITPQAGFTQQTTASQGVYDLLNTYIAPITNSRNGWTFNFAVAGNATVGVCEVANAKTSLDGSSTVYDASRSGTTAVTPSITNDLPMAFFGSNTGKLAVGAGSTIQVDQGQVTTGQNAIAESMPASFTTSPIYEQVNLSGLGSGALTATQVLIPALSGGSSGGGPNVAPGYTTETPIKGGDFVDTIGLNTHFSFGSIGWTEQKNENGMNAALFTLGVRHIRDYATYAYNTLISPSFFNALKANSDINLDAVLNFHYGDHSDLPGELAAKYTGLQSIEGPNETNIYPQQSQGKIQDPCPGATLPGGYSCWVQDTSEETAYYAPLTRAIGKPFYGPSIVPGTCNSNATITTNNGTVVDNLDRTTTAQCPIIGQPDLSAMPNQGGIIDFCNMHSYQGGQNPAWSGLTTYLSNEVAYAGSKPCVITENGYGTNENSNTDQQIAMYEPRIFLEDYLAGVPLTFQFELVDQPANAAGGYFNTFGLARVLNANGSDCSAPKVACTDWILTPKPQYEALRNMIELMDDTGPSWSQLPVTYQLTTSSSSVHHLLLANRDGSYWLALWNEVADSFPQNSGAQNATISFSNPAFTNGSVVQMTPANGQFTSAGLTAKTNQYGTVFGPYSVTGAVSFYHFSNSAIAAAAPLPVATPFPLTAVTPGPYQTTSPGVAQTASVSLSPTSLQFSSPTAASRTVAISDGTFNGKYTITASTPGIVSTSVAGNTLTVAPVAGGQTSVSVSDGSTSASVSVSVTAAPPVTLSPTSLQFSSPTSPSQTVAISDGSFNGTYTITASTPGIVSTSVAGNTLTVAPVTNGSTTLSVSDGTTSASVNVGVTAAVVAPPISVSPTSLQFTSPTASSQTVTISDGSFNGTYAILASAAGIVTTSTLGNTLTVSPNSAGQTTLTVSDGSTSATVGVSVAQPVVVTYTAPALVQPCATAHHALNASTSASATLLSPATVGNVLVAGYAAANPTGQSITPPSGNAWSIQAQPNSGYAELLTVFSAPVTAAQQSFAFTQAVPSSNALTLCEFTNVSYVATSSASANGKAISTPSITPSVTNSFPISFFGLDHYPIATPQSSWGMLRYVGAPYRQSLHTQIGPVTTLNAVHGGITTTTAANIAGATLVLAGQSSTAPAASFTSSRPQGYPVPATFPQTGNMTIVAQIKCSATTTGSAVASVPNGWDLDAGLCDNSANPIDSTGLHFSVLGTGVRVVSPTALSPSATYTIVGSYDGTNANLYVCPFPASLGPCVQTSLPSGALTYNGTSGFIGSGPNGARPFSGDIWNVTYYSNALTPQQVNGIAASGTADPYGNTNTTAPTDTRTPSSDTPGVSVTHNGASAPVLVYSNSVPGTPAPTTLTNLPNPTTMTFLAQLKCNTMSSGGTIINFTTAFAIEAGSCNSGPNPQDATGAHIYGNGPGVQAGPAATDNGLSFGQTYTIAASADGANLNYYVCPFPNGACKPYSTAAGPLTYNGTSAILGATDTNTPPTRLFSGDMWNVAFYSGALSPSAIQAYANNGVADPYSAATPGPLAATPSSLTFQSGTSAAQTISMTDPGYSGTFSASSSAPSVATVVASNSTISVTPHASGSAIVTITGYNGTAISVGVSVLSTTAGADSACSLAAANPIMNGCFTGNSPYHQTVASLVAAGATVSCPSGCAVTSQAIANYYHNGWPALNTSVGSRTGGFLHVASASDPSYNVFCPAYGACGAATSVSGKQVHIPSGVQASTDSDHHIAMVDSGSQQEIDMWGGFAGTPGIATFNGVATPVGCQINYTDANGKYWPGLNCSSGGPFAFSGNGLETNGSGNAGGVAFGLAGLTAGDILSGHITHALGMLSPCLDNGGVYPGEIGRGTDAKCSGTGAVTLQNGQVSAEPTLTYGAMLALRPSVDLTAAPYSGASQFCKVVLKAYQEYGAYTDDNTGGYGVGLIVNNGSDPGWDTIAAGMTSSEVYGSNGKFGWFSCLEYTQSSDWEEVILNQGDGTQTGGNNALPGASATAVNYPAPWPQWPNGLAVTTVVDQSRITSQTIKPYDSAAIAFYHQYNPTFTQDSGSTPQWNPADGVISVNGAGYGSSGYIAASASDPIYTLYCQAGNNFCGKSDLVQFHIPNGAQTQNSGTGSCDCHLYVLQPLGYTPAATSNATWPTLKAGDRYEVDIENAFTSAACAANTAPGQTATFHSTLACTTFTGGGGVYVNGGGAEVFSTGSTGWGGATDGNPRYNGFSPDNTPPSGWLGSSTHSNTPFTTLTVTAEDYLQGAINHEMFYGALCAQPSQTDVWPSSNLSTDFSCSGVSGGTSTTGWAYGDHIVLQMSDAQIDALGPSGNGTLTTTQVIFAKGMAHYGAVVGDTIGTWGPAYVINLAGGESTWAQVATKYNLPSTGTNQWRLNLGLPWSVWQNAHAVNSCVIQRTC